MPVSVAIVGPPGAGKTTLFNALTAGRGADGVGMVDVPDDRLRKLALAVHPKKVTPAQVRVADAPPGSRARQVAAAREADVILQVARGFGSGLDPAGDLASVQLDMILADLASVEKRLEVLERDAKAGRKHSGGELDALRSAKDHLEAGRPLRTLEPGAEAAQALGPLFPVSIKPSVLVANVSDDLLPGGGDAGAIVRAAAAERGEASAVLSARLESELEELEPADAGEYRASFGITESGLGAVARAAWDVGGLITFFTAGEPEVRAWPVAAGAPAPIAAGVIHSDFERHFIRAEVTSVTQLVEAGSMEALRAAGRLRVEGRDYQVRDGDVVFFRIGR
ncbi:MAG: DUF933 domain-containing protein [Candidatus Dormibacteraceae bacterium]